MKMLITEFISLDGVVQAPGGASEDTDGGFSHGGWSMKYFDPVVMAVCTPNESDVIWNPSTIIRGVDFLRTVTELRARPGGYIYVYGSATLVRSLLAADLVDELLLTIEPIILGGGKTIFGQNGKAIPFALESTTRASTGAQVCRYVRAQPPCDA